MEWWCITLLELLWLPPFNLGCQLSQEMTNNFAGVCFWLLVYNLRISSKAQSFACSYNFTDSIIVATYNKSSSWYTMAYQSCLDCFNHLSFFCLTDSLLSELNKHFIYKCGISAVNTCISCNETIIIVGSYKLSIKF